MAKDTAEHRRLEEERCRQRNWKRWGPYLSERQWGTVREDYSPSGDAWRYFDRDQAHLRAYRWGEDGLLGITDRQCRLCFSLALWNERDPILKERLFGLTGHEGNHGEDVKECYYYLDSTPTHSYMKALYKYPQSPFPYDRLIKENGSRGRNDREFELCDTGVFDQDRYFDVFVEYAKNSPNDILIKLSLINRSPEAARLHVLPTLWFRNTWTWNCDHEGCSPKPSLWLEDGHVRTSHALWEPFRFFADEVASDDAWLFTDNETNTPKLYGTEKQTAAFKDGFHDYVVSGVEDAVFSEQRGTKVAPHFQLALAPLETQTIRLRLTSEKESSGVVFGDTFEQVFLRRRHEADEYHRSLVPEKIDEDDDRIVRQANAGLLWTKQFYHYVVEDWLEGDPEQPAAEQRKQGRNIDWRHVFNRDVISMPDKWEYPWYAAWDSAFHMIPFSSLDPHFAQDQLILFLREWYMHPNGQLPAYEWALGDVNPPVHAWACWQYYQETKRQGHGDREFLARAFQKLLLNFTWWVNRKDVRGQNIFSGGFLGLDNIGVFDRSKPLPTGGHLEQADGTAWVAHFCANMLAMALELAAENPVYSDMASKFFEHYIHIAEAMNTLDGTGLWDERDGFYYDHLHVDQSAMPLRIRSMVGLIPLFTAEVLSEDVFDRLPGFKKRTDWFLENRELSRHMSCLTCSPQSNGMRLMAIPSKKRLQNMLRYLLDENEFLSPFGIRSLSKYHDDHPFTLDVAGEKMRVQYMPGESDSAMFGGNSNWRGPVWLPVNFLLIASLRKFADFYGDTLKVECPTGSGHTCNLYEVANEIESRVLSLFRRGSDLGRPLHGQDARYVNDPHWKDLVLYYEYFHGDSGRGMGASHQTGWTALIASMLLHSYARRDLETGSTH